MSRIKVVLKKKIIENRNYLACKSPCRHLQEAAERLGITAAAVAPMTP